MTIERAMELQENLAKEAVAMLVIHGESISVRNYETCITLIGKAWNVPAEDTEKQFNLIDEENGVVSGAEDYRAAIHVLPESELPMNATGTETLDNIWGLFETSLRLDTEDERMALFHMARELEECQNLLDWIEKSPSEQIETLADPN